MRKVPTLEHVSIWVKNGSMQQAFAFFKMIGWHSWPNRHVTWVSGQALFFHPQSVSVYIQITEEKSQLPGEAGSAMHIALTCDVKETLAEIRKFGTNYELEVISENVNDGKVMVMIPELFHCAIELVPQVHPDLVTLVTGSRVAI